MTRIVRATRERSRWWLSLSLLAVLVGTLTLAQGAFSQPSTVTRAARPARPARLAALACGAQVKSSVTLTADLIGCPGKGLEVGANGVTINLNGHTLSGTGVGAGVDTNDWNSVVVKNGVIANFNVGVYWFGTVTGSLQSLRVFDNASDGIQIDAGKATVTNNVVDENGGDGIQIMPGAAATITGNRLLGNGTYGIIVNTKSATSVTGNTANANGADGIWVWPAAKPGANNFSSTPITVSANSAHWNAHLGINSGADDIDAGKNTASGNGSTHQCENVVCS